MVLAFDRVSPSTTGLGRANSRWEVLSDQCAACAVHNIIPSGSPKETCSGAPSCGSGPDSTPKAFPYPNTSPHRISNRQ